MFFVMCNDTFPSFLQKLAGGGARREAVEGWSATCRAEPSQISPSSADGPSLESHCNPKGPAEMLRGKIRLVFASRRVFGGSETVLLGVER